MSNQSGRRPPRGPRDDAEDARPASRPESTQILSEDHASGVASTPHEHPPAHEAPSVGFMDDDEDMETIVAGGHQLPNFVVPRIEDVAPITPPIQSNRPVRKKTKPGRALQRWYGEVIDKYRIIELIGKGAMGAVFLAEHTALGKRVAIKVLLVGHEPGSDSERRFIREARTVGTLGHPNIVQVFDLGTLDDGAPYLVMESLDGETLADRIDRVGPMPIVEACTVIEQVLSAIHAAHQRGIIHRDLKSENVFIARVGDGTEVVKLLDFGISKNLDSNTVAITRPGAVVGTPLYLSPEQAKGATLDQRVDLWAVGVLLYESLTANLPFVASNYPDLIKRILGRPPAMPSSYRPEIPRDIESVVLKALQRDANRRFQSAYEMLAALRQAVQTVPEPPATMPLSGERLVEPAAPIDDLGIASSRISQQQVLPASREVPAAANASSAPSTSAPAPRPSAPSKARFAPPSKAPSTQPPVVRRPSAPPPAPIIRAAEPGYRPGSTQQVDAHQANPWGELPPTHVLDEELDAQLDDDDDEEHTVLDSVSPISRDRIPVHRVPVAAADAPDAPLFDDDDEAATIVGGMPDMDD